MASPSPILQFEASQNGNALGTPENDNIFVYKIIHDLRHPTQALADGLVGEACSFQKANDSVVSKNFKFKGHPRVQKAVKVLKAFIN
jgi:hypothetical protein